MAKYSNLKSSSLFLLFLDYNTGLSHLQDSKYNDYFDFLNEDVIATKQKRYCYTLSERIFFLKNYSNILDKKIINFEIKSFICKTV